METINKKNLLKYIEEHPDINYIAHVATPMTVIWAKVCLYYMHDEMHINRLNGIFVVNAWTSDKWAIKEELPVKTSGTEWLDEPEWFVADNNDESTITGIKDVGFALRRQKNKRIVYMIDTDSLWIMHSVYARKISNIELKHIYLDFDHEPYNLKERFIDYTTTVKGNGFLPILRRDTRRHVSVASASLFNVNLKRINAYDKQNFFSEQYIRYTRKVLEDEKGLYSFSPVGNYIIYLSDPYEPDDIPVVAEIAEELLVKFYKRGYKIYVKQHPRETGKIPFKEIEVEYLPNKYAIEALVASCDNKPKAIVAGSTSAIIEIARLWNIDCYFILNDNRVNGSPSLEWFRNYTNCAISKIPNLMNADECPL